MVRLRKLNGQAFIVYVSRLYIFFQFKRKGKVYMFDQKSMHQENIQKKINCRPCKRDLRGLQF